MKNRTFEKFVSRQLLRFAFALVFAVPIVVTAQTNVIFDLETEVFANPANTNDQFGGAVAISGDTAAIGAMNWGHHGAVFLFTGAGTNWVQQQILSPPFFPFPPLEVDERFGTSVAIDGDYLVAGAPAPQLDESHIFHRIGTNWFWQAALFTAATNHPFDRFGAAVGINGNTIVVGAPGFNAPGAAYVFGQIGTNWLLQAKFAPADLGTNDAFGSSVAILGNTIVVGAPTNGSAIQGAAYVFVRNGTNWFQQQKLVASDALPFNRFGQSVAIAQDLILVGSPNTKRFGPNIPLENEFGSAYFFTRSGSTWTQHQEVVADPGESDQRFGWSVALRPNLAVIGAFGGSPGSLMFFSGSAYIFTFEGGNWVQQQQIFAFQRGFGDVFGSAVALDKNTVVVGEPLDDQAGTDAGAAFFFTEAETNAPIVITNAFASPSVLFPPNHKFVPVTLTVATQGNDISCKIVSVSSNEPRDKQTPTDWIITGDLTLLLRAERLGKDKNGRTYTIGVECKDSFGNTSATNIFVTVPHDNGNRKNSSR